ncbi:carboxylesterase/lipase family protein [Vineibacter terrae]|nr:carboxylesterase family protein [Vineibacter terrae]
MPDAARQDDGNGRTRTAPVRIDSGSVIGSDGPVRCFKGIPFAAPPVGERRWRPPQPAVPWKGDRLATAFGPDCPQAPSAASRGAGQDEDCLHLSVWTPARRADEKLPVMVWLHGGGFTAGSSADARSDGEKLARSGVVVVAANYRVGLFGFLAHPELSRESPQGVSGNYGLLDQIAALQWVQRNIAAFGGDPGRVTTFGVSAGSASLALLATSPLTDGLMHQVILQSPGSFRPLARLAEAEALGSSLAPSLAALRQLSAAELFAKTAQAVPAMRGLTSPRLLRPIWDGCVLPQDERPAYRDGHFQAVPMIIGNNSDEGSMLTAQWTVRTRADYRTLLAESFGAMAEEALALYPAETDSDVRAAVACVFADTQFNFGVRGVARASIRQQPRTWRYAFTRHRAGGPTPPNHGDEVGYVFGNLAASRTGAALPFDARDTHVSDAMIGAWARFATTGDPNGGALPAWPVYDTANDPYLELGGAIGAGHGWRTRHMDFLDRFYDSRAGGERA